MAPELALGGLQRWMQAVIAHPGTLEEALGAGDASSLVPPSRLASVIEPSSTLTAAERLGIYHGMYRLRMGEALESDYPGLAHFLGPEAWAEVVRGYVTAHPSTSYTLNVLGRRLPEWLAAQDGLQHRAFCADLARLEWAVCESFDAAEAPRLEPDAIDSLAPEDWPEARLVPSPALRLVRVAWNAGEWLDTAKDEAHRHPRPRRNAGFVVVFRQELAVYRREAGRAAFSLLSDLAAGRRVGDAVARSLRRRGAPDSASLARWFRQWAADGAFTRIDLGDRG